MLPFPHPLYRRSVMSSSLWATPGLEVSLWHPYPMEAADLPTGWAHLVNVLLHNWYPPPCWGMNRGSPWSPWLFLVAAPSLGRPKHGPTSLSPSLILGCFWAFLLRFISPLDWAACPPSHIWCNFHCYNPPRGMGIPCSLKPEWLHRVLHVFHVFLWTLSGLLHFFNDLRQYLREDIIFELSWGT